MATDQVDACVGAEDRITDLPDDVLHSILLRLPSTAEAARTSVLSRRWRRVWTGVPVLSFRCTNRRRRAQQQGLDRIDAVLSDHAAATVERLEITGPHLHRVPTFRVARWLRFASLRLTGELRLAFPSAASATMEDRSWEEVVIPLCERVTAISLCLNRTLRFPLYSAAGAFTALAALEITQGCIDAGELQLVLCSRCPHLKKLSLEKITLRPGQRGLSIRSDSLEQLGIAMLWLMGSSPRGPAIQVATRELQSLSLGGISCHLCLVAPKLSELYSYGFPYDPTRHRLEGVPRHLRRMRVAANSCSSTATMRLFDTVDELNLVVSIRREAHHYETFLQSINHLSKCEVLVLTYSVIEHALKPTMVHLLTKCAGVTKIVIVIDSPVYGTGKNPCDRPWTCQCEWPKIFNIDDIVLCSLKEVEIRNIGGYAWSKAEFVELLYASIGSFGKTVPITIVEN